LAQRFLKLPLYSRIMTERKKRGRPPTGVVLKIAHFRVTDAKRAEIELWRANQPDAPQFSDALRRLVDIGLNAAVTNS